MILSMLIVYFKEHLKYIFRFRLEPAQKIYENTKYSLRNWQVIKQLYNLSTLCVLNVKEMVKRATLSTNCEIYDTLSVALIRHTQYLYDVNIFSYVVCQIYPYIQLTAGFYTTSILLLVECLPCSWSKILYKIVNILLST